LVDQDRLSLDFIQSKIQELLAEVDELLRTAERIDERRKVREKQPAS
jgi:hypothetical protein